MVQDCVAKILCRRLYMLLNNSVNFIPLPLIAAVIDAICIKEENVSAAHEGNFLQVKGIQWARSMLNREIPVSVGMVFGDFKSKCGELRHTALPYFHEPPVFGREHKRWWVAKVHKSKNTVRMYLSIKHGCDLARTVFRVSGQSVPGRNGLCKSQVDPLENFRCCLSVVIELGKHGRMKSVMHRGRDLGSNDPMPLGIDHQRPCSGKQLL